MDSFAWLIIFMFLLGFSDGLRSERDILNKYNTYNKYSKWGNDANV